MSVFDFNIFQLYNSLINLFIILRWLEKVSLRSDRLSSERSKTNFPLWSQTIHSHLFIWNIVRGMAWQSPPYATLLILASECCSRGLNLCCCSLEEIRKRFKSVCLQTFSRSMIGRGVHVTMAEDILYLLFTFCGKTFGYDIFIFHHIWLSVFLMYNPACFPLLCSIFSGRNWQSYSQGFLRNKHLIALAALIFTNYSVEL